MASSADGTLALEDRGVARGQAGRRLRVGIVAGEASGDFLGAELMEALRRRFPAVEFEGIGGPRMTAAGCHSFCGMDDISLLGFDDLLEKLLGILRIRRRLIRHFVQRPPDVFVGVDVPDFNLPLEKVLKRNGVPTVHYVSPTVWAWRGYRVRKIHHAVDHMLTLFPFEADFYRRHGVAVTYVGHPMADQIPGEPDRHVCRAQLGLATEGQVVALLPGSRRSELRRHAPLFVRTARWLYERNPKLRFVAPFADPAHRELFTQALAREGGAPALPVTLLDGNARLAMGAADVVLLASGTAALEAALLRRPMVVTYRLTWFSYRLIRMLAHVRLYSMPNHLAGRELVPELIQRDAVAEKLGPAIQTYLRHPEKVAEIRAAFDLIHDSLKVEVEARAVVALVSVMQQRELVS